MVNRADLRNNQWTEYGMYYYYGSFRMLEAAEEDYIALEVVE